MKLLRYYRLKAGLSQAELARRVGTSQPKISQWENGLEMDIKDLANLFIVLMREGVVPYTVLPTALGEDLKGEPNDDCK